MRRYIITATALAALLAVGASAAAQPSIRASAERLVSEETALQRGGGVQRSMVRTWAGVGLMAGGAGLAIMPKSCRLEGALSPDVEVFRYSAGALGYFQGEDAVVTKVDGRCALDYDVGAFFAGGFYVSPITTQKASEVDGFDQELAAVRGTAAAHRFTPAGAFYGGIALIAGGALLAAFWADTPVAESLTFTPLRGGGLVGASLGF